MASKVNRRIVVALDFADPRAALECAARLDPGACRVKIGKELFTRAGPEVVGRLRGLGFEVFLDLKFHDIPNTVAGACAAAAELGCWMINVHASGGRAMLQAARAAVPARAGAPLLVAVTVLTSLDDAALAEVGVGRGAAAQARALALLARECGLDGVVASAHEVADLRAACGAQFKLVIPGIRPAGSAAGDQRRVATPAQAVRAGADFLVIGRPITQAPDPARAVADIQSGLEG
ncbi:MAG: orotidine-5'-phosphate decarboxylase [Gammaproteobacteria bacterium]